MNRTNVARLETNPMGMKIHCPQDGLLSYVTIKISETLKVRRIREDILSLVILLSPLSNKPVIHT
jgi:hypothetical protein